MADNRKTSDRPQIRRRTFLRSVGVLGVGSLGVIPERGRSQRTDAPQPFKNGKLKIPSGRYEQSDSSNSSKHAVGSFHETYEGHPVLLDDIADQPAIDARDFTADSNADGSVIGVGTAFDGFNEGDTYRELDFNGDGEIDLAGTVTPPDTQIAAGPDQLVSVVNTEVGIFDRNTGEQVFRAHIDNWFDDLLPDGVISKDYLAFDPRASYDPVDERFYFVTAAFDTKRPFRLDEGYWLLSVSDSDNPIGSWTNYRIPPVQNNGFLDYPGFGYNRNALYITQNFYPKPLFEKGVGDFIETTLVVVEKDDLGSGGTVDAHHFRNLRGTRGRAFTVQPAIMPESTGPFYLLNTRFGSGSTLTRWTVTDPTDPDVTIDTIDVTPYSNPPPVYQTDSGALLTGVGTKITESPAWNADRGTLWTAHATDVGGRAGIRWYEINPVTATVVQSGTHTVSPSSASAFFPSLATNGEGTMMVYSVAGPDTFPRMDVTGRRHATTQGELDEHITVKAGESTYDYNDPPARWGDYLGIEVDPSDSSRFWALAPYSPDFQKEYWATRFAEVFFQ